VPRRLLALSGSLLVLSSLCAVARAHAAGSAAARSAAEPEIPISDGRAAFVGMPAWSAARQTIYEAQAALFGAAGPLGNGVRAFQVTAGCRFTEAWAAPLGDGSQATPLVVGDVVFATGGKPGGFFALDVRNGARLWSAPTDGRTVAATIRVGGSIFGADTKGTVYAFRPAPFRGSPLLSQ
jgi:outer membrane protein assembly factor BamB